FILPISREDELLQKKMAENGGKFGYVDNPYPCGLFARRLSELDFGRLTVLYGGNGSGKSTLLNLIAARLELNRIAPYNSGELFDEYAAACDYELGYDDEGFRYRIPNGSRIITSDDIFDYMLAVRTNNGEISAEKAAVRASYRDIKGREIGDTVKMRSLDDYEAVRTQLLARSKSVSRREFIRRVAGSEVPLRSNGETALDYFEAKLKNDTLYCLDEPENSLSPKLQMKLAATLTELVRYCGVQLIIATHSPFLLAMDGARIYDLDAEPSVVKDWWELENCQAYFNFFEKNRHLFG
ncbi:MAG: ATP-binding cassette domain-containing protein, partial [Ruminococcaceae bacterium]|nr:ATP-binding cassette domain-containing protein [Oscillospiraceae bacterium]